MDELKRLVKLVNQYSPKTIPLLDPQTEDSLETKLFTLITQQEVRTDEEASLMLYGKKRIDASYRMLKSRMRRRLLSHFHFFEFNERTTRPSGLNEYKCSGILLEAQCMTLANEYDVALKQVNQVISLARKHELNNVIVKALEMKQVVNSALQDYNNYLTTKIELEHYYDIERQERIASDLFRGTHLQLSLKVSTRSTLAQIVPDVLEKLLTSWGNTRSSSIYNFYHILSIHYLELNGKYNSISEAVERAQQMLDNGELHNSWFNFRYNYFIRIYALLRTQQYELGLNLAQDYLKFYELNSVNWFAFMENYLLLALHSRQYDFAGELLVQTLNNSFIQRIQEPAKERWELYRRYLVLMGEVQPEQLKVELPKRVLKLLVKLSHDKAGYNLSLLVLDIIQSFSSASIDSYEPQTQRLKKYITKYLRGEKAERPRYFLRLLQLAIKKELSYKHTKAAGANLYAKLSQTPPPGDAFADVEIIPYEHLWEVVLRVLEVRENKLKGKKR